MIGQVRAASRVAAGLAEGGVELVGLADPLPDGPGVAELGASVAVGGGSTGLQAAAMAKAIASHTTPRPGGHPRVGFGEPSDAFKGHGD